MIRWSRSLATRLRRIATRQVPHRNSLGRRPASAEAWERLESALSASAQPTATTRRHELAHERVRLAITLVGQQGRGAVVRILAACDGDVGDANDAVRIALAVAATLGHTA